MPTETGKEPSKTEVTLPSHNRFRNMQGGRKCGKVGAKRTGTAILAAFAVSKGKHFRGTPRKKRAGRFFCVDTLRFA